MREEPASWKHGVVLVCTNERAAGAAKPSCGHDRGLKLRHWLKAACRGEDGPVSECRVLATSCLDTCPADGVAVALEPGGRVLVVDPEADGDALLAEVTAHMQGLAAPTGVRSKARSVLGRLRKG